MSDERWEQEEREDEDVEAHKKVAAHDEPKAEEEADEVEAHAKRAKA